MLLGELGEINLEAIFDAIEEPVLIINREYQLVAANAAARTRYDWIDQERVHFCYRLTHSLDHPCVDAGMECPVRTVFATGSSARVVHIHTAKDGASMIEEVIASPLGTGSGRPRYVVEEIRDLTQHARDVIGRLHKELKTLRGILPICASCKRIRDSDGGWVPVDQYISANTEADFSHGLCPACVAALYPGHGRKD